MFYRLMLFICLTVLNLPIQAKDKTLLLLGDSLSAAYGIPVTASWTTLLKQRLLAQGYDVNVVNASSSGETTVGALSRIKSIMTKYQPDFTIIELGGNDGLRGFALAAIEQNLSLLIEEILQQQCKVLLIPMQLPPNYGPDYNRKFQAIYQDIAKKHDVALSAFILENIAVKKELMQPDGIHPVAEAQPMMLDNIWPAIKQLISD